MIVYLAMLTFVCALALGSVFLPQRVHVVRSGIALVGYGAMCIFIGLRDQVGADWGSYKVIFTMISKMPFIATLFIAEPLYGLCNRFVYLAGGDIHLVNLICAIILLVCLFNFSRLVDLDSNLVLFIATPYILFVIGMGYTRQSVALGLVLNAVGYLRHRREGMFYFFVVLGTLFHYSAIVLILLWWLKNFKRIALVVGLLAIASPVLFKFVSGGRYMLLYFGNNAVQSHGVWMRLLLVFLGFLVIVSQKVRWARETQLRKVIFRGAIALGVLAIVGFFLSTVADRICVYLSFIYLLGIGSVIRYAMRPFKFLSVYFVVCLTYGLFFVWFGLSTFAASDWFPYGMAFYSRT